MSTTPLQKCMLAAIEKAAITGRRMTTGQAKKICSKKFPIRFKKQKPLRNKNAHRN